jgi:hypothetical protein
MAGLGARTTEDEEYASLYSEYGFITVSRMLLHTQVTTRTLNPLPCLTAHATLKEDAPEQMSCYTVKGR